MEKALEWWSFLPQEGKDQFPSPKNNEDILGYFTDPAYFLEENYFV